MTPVLIPCASCKGLALWGTLVVGATHRLFVGPEYTELYLCQSHADGLATSPLLRCWETL